MFLGLTRRAVFKDKSDCKPNTGKNKTEKKKRGKSRTEKKWEKAK